MNGIRLEFSNVWMHSKLSFEKKSISMNFGSIMEQDEKRFVYRICCSSNENNEAEGIEEGIGVSWVSECRWLWFEEPFRFFDGSTILRDFLKFQSVQMKENEKWWSLGFVGSDLDKKWVRYGRRENWERGFSKKWEVADFWFWIFNI